MKPVKLLVADDHELVRKGLVAILQNAHTEWDVVGEAATGPEAITLAEQFRPDVAILDLSMPGLNGLQVTGQLVEKLPGIRIMILTMHAAEPVMRQLRRAGASAYMLKNEAPRRLVLGVERMISGEPFFASDDAYRPASAIEGPEFIPIQYLLTQREMDVLKLLASGRSNKELAGDLDMSVRTAESHRASILAKLGVESLGDLVRMAVRDGLV